tara:strand:+ start:2133 stop:2771 length:639 start_codon:yes stop_codon:yes gene_type:complete
VSIFFLFSVAIKDNNFFNDFITSVLLVSVIFWILVVPILLYRTKNFSGNIATSSALVITLASFYASVWAVQIGISYFFSILLVVWVADTAGYFFGRFFGKRKLAAKISPNKTWEGVYGAVSIALIVAWFAVINDFGWYYEIERLSNLYIVFLIVFLATVISIIGDLYQSLIKREAKVKDSGKILPGHGGFYDRFDAVIAVCPFLILSVKIIQ